MISNKTFVKAWMESDSLGDVAKRLGISKASTSSRATQLRTKGVRLPNKNPVHNNEVSVSELNDIINSYRVRK